MKRWERGEHCFVSRRKSYEKSRLFEFQNVPHMSATCSLSKYIQKLVPKCIQKTGANSTSNHICEQLNSPNPIFVHNKKIVDLATFRSRSENFGSGLINLGLCQGNLENEFNHGEFEGTWRIIPFSKWLITMVSKSPNWGCGTPSKWPFHGL